jgi:TolB-like protein/class 3 adenylate cyclase
MLQGPAVPTERVERRLAAVLAADVAGYSRLMGADEGCTLRQLKAHRRAVVDPKIAEYRGRIVKTTGDGMLVEFASVVDAVRFAVEVQRGMVDRNANVAKEKRIEFRVGINVGDIIIDGGDIFGDGVNVAARLEALSDPGGICVSGRVQEDTLGRLPLSFEDKGDQHIKNIAHPVRVYALSAKTISELPSSLGDMSKEEGASSEQPRRKLRLPSLRGSRWSAAVLMLVALAAFGAWQATELVRMATGKHSAEDVARSSAPSVAVLSFDNLTGDAGQDYFGDGLSEELITSLSQFEPLRVLARNTTFAYRGKAADVSEIGHKLRAQYVVEGSFRRAADTISVTSQLIDARTGNHVWAQTFERGVGSTSLLTIQNEVARRIGAAIGDQSAGAIGRIEFDRSRSKVPSELSSYECLLQSYQVSTAELARRARLCAEAAVGREPTNSLAWSTLSRVLTHQRWWGTGLDGAEADDVEKRAYLVNRAIEAANRAVNLAPQSALAHLALFSAYWLTCQTERMQVEADRVLALNPNDASLLGIIGNGLAYAGLWDLGVQLAEKALTLAGPSAPRWWWYAAAKDHYRKGQYEQALEYFRRAYVEQSWLDHLHLAYTLPYVGKVEEARAEIPILMRLKPTISVEEADRYYAMWCFDKDFRGKMVTALRLTGLREERGRISKNE